MTFSGLPSLRDPKIQQQQQQQQQQYRHHGKPSALAATATEATSTINASTAPTTPSTTAALSIPNTIDADATAPTSHTPRHLTPTEGSPSPVIVSGAGSNTIHQSQSPESTTFGLTPLALVDPRSALVSSSQRLQTASMNMQSEAQAQAQAHAQAQALAQLEATMALTDSSIAHFQQQQPQTTFQLQHPDQQQITPSQIESPSSAPSSSLTTATKPDKKASKKTTAPPVHNSAYRKRLNVNQVCDWCRYRKIRCDRESPCNSCIHSRRECIRSPPQLVATNSPADKPVTKRGRPAEDKEGRRSSKAYRSSDINSVRSSDHTSSSFSSPCTESEDDPLASLLDTQSPLAGNLNLSALAKKLSLDSPTTPSTEASMFDLMNGPPMVGQDQMPSILTSGLEVNASTGRPLSQEECEHFERMQRIELLLCKMIPGASEFIANGNRSQLQQQQHHQQSIGNMSAAEQSGSQNSLGLINQASSQRQPLPQPQPQSADQNTSSSTSQNADYIERMKRIEQLLSSMSDQPLTRALLSQIRSPKEDPSRKMGKREQKKALKAAQTSHGAPTKRPHVAAGFANQKPPPKLPQAIAEAAMKKQQAKKKRASAARAKNASAKEKKANAAALAAGTAGRESTDSPTPASPASSIATVGTTTDVYGASLTMPQASPFESLSQQASQTSFQLSSTFAQDPSAQVMYLPHQPDQPDQPDQSNQTMFSQAPTFQPLSVSNINSLSMTVPSSAYGSMFMPATSSTCSSSPSSPISASQEAIHGGPEDEHQQQQQSFAVQPIISTELQNLGTSESVFTSSLPTPTQQGQFRFSQPSTQQAQQQQNSNMSMTQGNFQFLQHLQRLQQQQQQQQQQSKETPAYTIPSFDLLDHTMQIGASSTPEAFSDFSQTQHNSMNESLGALMMPSSQVPMASPLGFQTQMQQQQQQQHQSFNGATTFDQTSVMQQQQHRHRNSFSFSQPQLSRAIWLPSSPESINISHHDGSTTATMPWPPISEKNAMFQDQQQQQQQQQLRRQSMMASLQKSHNQPHPLQQHHHQHQQSFYIPEMKDDDGYDAAYDGQQPQTSPLDETDGSATGSKPVMTVLAD